MGLSRALLTMRLEKINRYLPLLFIPPIIYEIATRLNLSSHQELIVNFAVKSLLLNHLHVVFTFAMLLFIPEMKSWMTKKPGHSALNFWVGIAGIMAVFFLISTISEQVFPAAPGIFFVAAFFVGIYNTQHLTFQCYGVSVLYGDKNSRSDIRFEKLIFHLLFIIIFIRLLLKSAQSSRFIESSIWLTFIDSLGLGLSIMAVLYLAFLAFRKNTEKSTYLLPRLSFILLIPDLFFAQMAILALHGIEYMFIFMTLSARSGLPEKTYRQVWLFVGAAAAICVLGLAIRQADGIFQILLNVPYKDFPASIKILASLSVGVGLTHSYIDGFIFKRRSF